MRHPRCGPCRRICSWRSRWPRGPAGDRFIEARSRYFEAVRDTTDNTVLETRRPADAVTGAHTTEDAVHSLDSDGASV